MLPGPDTPHVSDHVARLRSKPACRADNLHAGRMLQSIRKKLMHACTSLLLLHLTGCTHLRVNAGSPVLDSRQPHPVIPVRHRPLWRQLESNLRVQIPSKARHDIRPVQRLVVFYAASLPVVIPCGNTVDAVVFFHKGRCGLKVLEEIGCNFEVFLQEDEAGGFETLQEQLQQQLVVLADVAVRCAALGAAIAPAATEAAKQSAMQWARMQSKQRPSEQPGRHQRS